jgi:redox-sensitive bicupin YhaK (pirin superfamily)
MIQVVPKASRYEANHGWLKSDHHFSFADYYDPANMQFGALRVFNDDWVDPQRGFGAHPHRDMEIVSIVVNGALQHQDSTGRSEVIRSGEVQYMCAGTGIVHSEINPSATEAVNFLQLWFLPKAKGLDPVYAQKAYPSDQLTNDWVRVLAPSGTLDLPEHCIEVHQDVHLFLTKLSAGSQRTYQASAPDRRMYLYVIEGAVRLNERDTLNRRDAVRMEGEGQFQLQADEECMVLLIELA